MYFVAPRILPCEFGVFSLLRRPCKVKNRNFPLRNRHYSSENDLIEVTWILKDGTLKTTKGEIGTDLLKLAHKNDIELEGACEGSLACSTCHVIIEDSEVYESIPQPTDEENDMLDLAFGLTETSRLGCQVVLSEVLSGTKIKLPKATRNMMAEDYFPKTY